MLAAMVCAPLADIICRVAARPILSFQRDGAPQKLRCCEAFLQDKLETEILMMPRRCLRWESVLVRRIDR